MIPWEDVINRAGPPATLWNRNMSLLPRLFLASIASLASMTAAYSADPKFPPIVFVHGNGDTAALWMTQFWRFESNGYPEDHLFAVDIPHPSARADDNAVEPNRSSTTDAAQAVAGQVDEALKKTGAEKVVLVANSRGCQTARNYVKNFGGAAKVERMVLGGCVHHASLSFPGAAQGSEFNGADPSSRTFPPSRKCRRAFRSRSSAPTSSTSIRSRKANMSAWPATDRYQL